MGGWVGGWVGGKGGLLTCLAVSLKGLVTSASIFQSEVRHTICFLGGWVGGWMDGWMDE